MVLCQTDAWSVSQTSSAIMVPNSFTLIACPSRSSMLSETFFPAALRSREGFAVCALIVDTWSSGSAPAETGIVRTADSTKSFRGSMPGWRSISMFRISSLRSHSRTNMLSFFIGAPGRAHD